MLLVVQGNTERRSGLFSGTMASAKPVPVFGLSTALGELLLADNSTVFVCANNEIRRVYVPNLCGDTPAGDGSAIVLVGAHADSVAAGPGINDNGSGTAMILAIATAVRAMPFFS